MKPTHAQTPRSMADCHFEHGYTTEPAGTRSSDFSHGWYFIFGVIVGMALVIVWVTR